MTQSPVGVESVVWRTSPFEYGLVVLFAAVLAGMLSFLAPLAPAPFAFGFGVPALMAVYGLLGLVRPRRVSLLPEAMVIRPVIGKEKRHARQSIVHIGEIVTPPLGSLIARIRDDRGRTKGVVIQNRLVLADLSVRHGGRIVGIMPSVRERLLADWAGLDKPL